MQVDFVLHIIELILIVFYRIPFSTRSLLTFRFQASFSTHILDQFVDALFSSISKF